MTQGLKDVTEGNFEIQLAAGGFGSSEACAGSSVNNPQYYGKVLLYFWETKNIIISICFNLISNY